MQTILCIYCKKSFEVSEALAHQISEEGKKLQEEAIAKAREDEQKKAEKKLQEEISLKEKNYQNEIKENNERIESLMKELLKAREEERLLRQKDQERELETQKRLAELEQKAKEEAIKKVDEEKKYEILQMQKQLEDTKKALEEARRKSEQVSQQLQGEVLELDIENLLCQNFPQDVIEPIGKGVTGADIRQTVKSQIGNFCGVILWEFKRTKHWDDKWIGKLKDDLRNETANVPVIVSLELPKDMTSDLGMRDGVWICKAALIIPLAQLLREKLYEVAREKSRNAHSTEKAALVYQYVTSHEFQQQVESMVETYINMREQLQKEKTAIERIWKMREGQIERLLKGTANIIGSIEGRGASMPVIKGLDILELSDGEN